MDVLNADPVEMRQLQQQDPSLTKICEWLDMDTSEDPDMQVIFYRKNGLIFRSWHLCGTEPGDTRQYEQLLLLQRCHRLVLRLAHYVQMAGHLRVTKTKDILQRYYWPGIFKDVTEYCWSCEVCQRSQVNAFDLSAIPADRDGSHQTPS